MENKYDVIIIGAGLGGLSAGAKLSKSGKKVLLIEQHNVVGGAATIFERQRKMKFEVGLHEIDGLASDVKINQFKKLGVYEKVEFIRVPEFYRVVRGDLDVVVPDHLDAAEKELSEVFPSNENEISTYFSDVRKVRKQLDWIRKYQYKLLFLLPLLPILFWKLLQFRRITVGKYFDNLTDNEDLKLALIANIGYYHDNPYELSMMFFTGGQTSYMTGGGWFVKGGSQNLSDAFAEVILEHRGEIMLKHLVTEIILEGTKAVGVKYLRQKRPNAEEQTAYADYIIANAALPTVLEKLLPIDMDTTKLDKLQIGCSLNTIYYSFSEPVSDLTKGHYSTFIYNKDSTDLHKFAAIERTSDYWKKGFVFVDYTSIDSGLQNQEHHTGVVCGIDRLENWSMDREEYKEKKENVIEIFTQRLEQQFPGIRDRIQYAEMSTPRTIKRYTLNPHGTVYGFAPTPGQFFKDRTKYFSPQIENLDFASAWMLSGGFSSAISSGYLAAKRVLKALGVN